MAPKVKMLNQHNSISLLKFEILKHTLILNRTKDSENGAKFDLVTDKLILALIFICVIASISRQRQR